MHGIASDLRLAGRQLHKSPGFAITVVLMLAFGIGATTAIFSIVDGVLLHSLPFPHPDRLVTLGDQVAGTDWGQHDPGPVTAPEVLRYPRDTRSFSSLGGYGGTRMELSGSGRPETISVAQMTPSVFTTLGVQPLLGRIFTPQEDTGHQQVAVLSYRTWQTRFGGDPKLLGSKILLNRKPYVVIGVMPRAFEFPLVRNQLYRAELWVPISFSPDQLTPEADGDWYLNMVGRLKPGVTVAQAEADANQVAAGIMRGYPADIANFRFHAVIYPLQQITVENSRSLLRMLFWAVSVVLAIACANFAGLLMVRAIRRQCETAVRMALGATARTLLRQAIAESTLLSLAGGLLDIGLAAMAIYGGRNFLPSNLPLANQIALNWRVAGFALLLALLTGVVAGLAPGLASLRTNVNARLKEGGRTGSAGSAHARLRSALVVAEIAVALVLLATSGLLLRSFQKMNEVDLGFRPDHVTTAVYSLPPKQYAAQARIDTFNRDLLARLRQQPGVISVGLTTTIPATGDGLWSMVPEGYVDPRGPDRASASPTQVIGDYFQTMGIPLLAGRYFTESDTADNQLVVIVNHELAEHYWPHQSPIGKRLREGTEKSKTPWLTVVGEVADAKLGSPDQDASEQFYLPVAQLEKDAGSEASPDDLNGNEGYVVVRTALPPEQMEPTMRRVVQSLDPDLPLSEVATMEQVLSQSESSRRFNTAVIAAFAVAAVLLAGLGIYSIVAFSVASRVQEMAIRLALGSPRARILRLVLSFGGRLALLGAGLGIAGTLVTSRLVRSFLFQVGPFDPVVLLLAAVSVFALALLASAIPAWRAARVDPNHALHSE
ncbi:ABC transporter permease [Silvibacterium dinghuense]|uniref:ABC transporter permease n=1 Tax=Silvibacterium dinghuense TaxID=1560006 RepID=A0A4Q1SKN4_9BACT|nr:ABC transporter permease [Silvibacterium dinghuense]RXS98029.1 ABC transporter permease [Silvibacterium dinghuense]GGH03945.1 hypothetical protein GCM10011586_19950 [Silvibacterium dinghuense]